MRQKLFFAFCCTLSLNTGNLFSDDISYAPSTGYPQPNSPSSNSPSQISWSTNYEEAVQASKITSKPLILFFTGSDWCTWCEKLEKNVLNTPEFISTAGNKFIFVKLDFPLYSSQDPQIKAQNQQLQKKFNVRNYPTIILFDANQNQLIESMGYPQGNPKFFADQLLKKVADYSSYQHKMGALETTKFSGQELKALYEQAKKLQLTNDHNKIVKVGIDTDESLYFLTERYRLYGNEGLIHTEEAKAIRHRLLAADPNNAKQVPYQVAVIEFQTFCEEMERADYAPELAIAPLISYIEKYGQQDKENLWRLQMLVSQVFLDRNQMQDALKYAQDSFEAAPATVQPEIAKAVQNISLQMHSSLGIVKK